MTGFSTQGLEEVSVMAPSPRKENCRLVDVKFDSEKGYLDFIFEDATGAQLRDRTFEPTRQSWHNTDEDFNKTVRLTMTRLKHIVGRFVGPEKAGNMSGNTWESFCNNVIQTLGSSYRGVKCDLKVVLIKQKDKWYSALPKVPDFISTEKYPKEFTIDNKYDIFEKPGDGISPSSETGAPPVAEF